MATPRLAAEGTTFVEPFVCADSLAQWQHMMENNRFKTKANLATYADKWLSGFTDDLDALGPDDQYFDSGSGAGIALSDYRRKGKAKTLGVVLVLPDGVSNQSSPRHRVLDRRFLEEIDEKEIGPTKVLSDFYGPAAYALHFERVINKYLAVVVEGGTINLVFDNYATYINTKDAGRLSLIDYLKLRLKGHEFDESVPAPGLRFRVTKQGPKKLRPLILKKLASDTPPYREYDEE